MGSPFWAGFYVYYADGVFIMTILVAMMNTCDKYHRMVIV